MLYRIHQFRELTSTNDFALALGEAGASEGVIIRADFQSRGRGRFSREWISEGGENLLFTILIRPGIQANQAALLTHVAAVSVKEGIEKIYPEIECKLKKPNDVLIRGKKVCGILVESRTLSNYIDFAVIGIGINTDYYPESLNKYAISISEEIKRKTEKEAVFDAVISKFSQKYHETLPMLIRNPKYKA